MGIFNFIKKLGKKKEIKEIVLEKLTLDQIENWLEEKKKENEIKENEVLVLVKDKINNFSIEIKTKIDLLKEVDVKSKKAEDRIKEIVKDSKSKYINAVEILIDSLENIKNNTFSEFTSKVDRIFLNFNKSSFKNYERATILIGKEIVDVKGAFVLFSKDLLNIFNNNKEISELFQKIEFLKLKLGLLEPIDKDLSEIKKEISSLEEKIDGKNKENKKLLNEIEEIKKSEDHKNMLDKKEKINQLKEELKNDLLGLRQALDFKALSNFFHINEKQIKILKEHKENFQVNFEKDNGKMILDLLDESKLNNDLVLEKINLIRNKKKEISNLEKGLEEDKTKKLNLNLKEILIKIDDFKDNLNREQKRNEKAEENRIELINSLKNELRKMGVEIV